MSITIKEIAKIAGVSIGTVDRALHNRGRIRPELARHILQIADEAGYTPSHAGRALALAKNPIKIGIIAHMVKTDFMIAIMRGIEAAKSELESLGAQIFLKSIESINIPKQLAAIDELVAEGVQGITISPAEDPAIYQKIKEVSPNIPIITFNTDIAGSGRTCFVGLNNRESGKAAAHLMATLVNGKGKVAIITGHRSNQACNHRVESFTAKIREDYPEIILGNTEFCLDKEEIAYELTVSNITNYPDIVGIFMCAGGQAGMCKALDQLGASSRVKVVAYDLFPATAKGLETGAIDFLIDQDAFLQGYRSAMLLYDKLFHNKEMRQEYFYTDIIIKTKYNV